MVDSQSGANSDILGRADDAIASNRGGFTKLKAEHAHDDVIRSTGLKAERVRREAEEIASRSGEIGPGMPANDQESFAMASDINCDRRGSADADRELRHGTSATPSLDTDHAMFVKARHPKSLRLGRAAEAIACKRGAWVQDNTASDQAMFESSTYLNAVIGASEAAEIESRNGTDATPNLAKAHAELAMWSISMETSARSRRSRIACAEVEARKGAAAKPRVENAQEVLTMSITSHSVILLIAEAEIESRRGQSGMRIAATDQASLDKCITWNDD